MLYIMSRWVSYNVICPVINIYLVTRDFPLFQAVMARLVEICYIL